MGSNRKTAVRSDTKITKITKMTKITNKPLCFVVFVAFVNFVPERSHGRVRHSCRQRVRH
jgi:hypothetical protein